MRYLEDSLRTASKVPPPEQRLCRKHNRPILPSRWLNRSRTSGCARCVNERIKSPAARKRRKIKWGSRMIFCINHPDRRCSRSNYVSTGHRYCGSCNVRKSNGEHRSSHVRSVNKHNYKMSLGRRKRLVGNLRGIDLFNRSIGQNLISATGAIQV